MHVRMLRRIVCTAHLPPKCHGPILMPEEPAPAWCLDVGPRRSTLRPPSFPMSPSASDLHAPHPSTGCSSALPLPSGPFRPKAGLLTARAFDAMALYDQRLERYLTLNPVATRIWELLSDGHPPAGIADRLCVEYAVPREQVTADVAAQIATFMHDRLIEPGTIVHGIRLAPGAAAYSSDGAVSPSATTGSVTARVRVPSVLRCEVTLARIKCLLQIRRFEGTIAWIRARVENIPATATVGLKRVRECEYAVAMAGALYPGRAKCLEQSLTLYYLARRQGVAVRYCQGMQLYPFLVHAWVEYQGQVINDVPEHVKHFTTFPDQLP